MKIKWGSFVVGILALIIAISLPTDLSFAKGERDGYLTPEQMKKAVVVADGAAESRLETHAEVYRLASCGASAPADAPCFFTIASNGRLPIAPKSVFATLTCGVDVYTKIGAHVGRLQQNVGIIFYGSYGKTPLVLQWGDLRGTWALAGYTWSQLRGPNPTPGWGVYVSRSGVASAISSGVLSLLIQGFPIQGYFSTRLNITPYGWYCS